MVWVAVKWVAGSPNLSIWSPVGTRGLAARRNSVSESPSLTSLPDFAIQRSVVGSRDLSLHFRLSSNHSFLEMKLKRMLPEKGHYREAVIESIYFTCPLGESRTKDSFLSCFSFLSRFSAPSWLSYKGPETDSGAKSINTTSFFSTPEQAHSFGPNLGLCNLIHSSLRLSKHRRRKKWLKRRRGSPSFSISPSPKAQSEH